MWLNLVLKLVLFVLLVPGVVVSFPAGASLKVRAVVHGVVFAVLNYFLYKFLEPMMRERFENPPTEVAPPCQKGYKSCPSGDCIPANDPHETCPGSTDAY
uniref:Uncharacterized protein n=1 Tax=viral metagenome TaxID=1070528 RepID=A0A6C0AI31_9ZZZZ